MPDDAYVAKLKVGIQRINPGFWDIFKHFQKVDNQTNLDLDEAALQKRFWNMRLSSVCHFDRGLDLFGGVGYSGLILSSFCDEVTMVEKDPETFKCLLDNLRGRFRADFVNCDNIEFMKEYKGPKFQIVDVDPFGTPIPQLDLLGNVFDQGVVMITSGSIMAVSRGLVGKSEYIPGDNLKKYTGKNAIRWAEGIYLPYLAETYDLKLEAYYLYPTSLRAVFTRDYKLPNGLFPGKKYLGWFGTTKNDGRG